MFQHGFVLNTVRPYTEMHNLNESSGQILIIVQSASTETLSRHSASHQDRGDQNKQGSYHRGAQRVLCSNHAGIMSCCDGDVQRPFT